MGVLYFSISTVAKQPPAAIKQPIRTVQVMSAPHFGTRMYPAFPAQFGSEIEGDLVGTIADLIVASPYRACGNLLNGAKIRGKIALVERSECMFIEKARNVQNVGGVGIIIVDHVENTSANDSSVFAMSGDGQTDLTIPVVFLFSTEGRALKNLLLSTGGLKVRIGEETLAPSFYLHLLLSHLELFSYQSVETCHSLVSDQNGNVNAYEIFNLGDFVCFREHDSAQLTCERKGTKQQNVYIFTISPGSLRQEELDAIERELLKTIAHESSLSSTEQQSKAECSKRSQVPEQHFHGTVLDISVDQNGQRSIKFKFSQFLSSDPDPVNVAEKHLIAEQLLSQLISETNIKDLPFNEDYLRVVRKIISMSMGDVVSLDKGDDILLSDLAYKIELRKESAMSAERTAADPEAFYARLGLVDNDGSCCWSAKWSDFIEYFSRKANTQNR